MIRVFSTYTKDILFDKNNNFIQAQKGGPAFFIGKIFKKNKLNYKLFSQEAEVKIKILNTTEKGKLITKLEEKKIKNIKKNDIVIVSTVGKEWILPDNIKGIVFLDVQGYIREAKNNPSFYDLEFWNNIFCIKGNKKEISKLPKVILDNQKEKLLIITNENKGAIIFFQGREYILKAKKVRSKDAIGAGDTFFGNFIYRFIKTKDVLRSGKFAISETENFLLKK